MLIQWGWPPHEFGQKICLAPRAFSHGLHPLKRLSSFLAPFAGQLPSGIPIQGWTCGWWLTIVCIHYITSCTYIFGSACSHTAASSWLNLEDIPAVWAEDGNWSCVSSGVTIFLVLKILRTLGACATAEALMKCSMSGCRSAFSIVFHFPLFDTIHTTRHSLGGFCGVSAWDTWNGLNSVLHYYTTAILDLVLWQNGKSVRYTNPVCSVADVRACVVYASFDSGFEASRLPNHPKQESFHCFHHSIPEDRKVAMQDHTSPLHIIHLPIVSHSQSLYESYTVAFFNIHNQSWYTHVWLLCITATYSYHTYHHDFTGYPTAGVG